ncbi:MAG: hypothetical protein FD153_64 [Rhodospirillaceae bacterium]|nr:MAG: hypothetical protein FD153_64 [Rhodospirillaceae bacterium]
MLKTQAGEAMVEAGKHWQNNNLQLAGESFRQACMFYRTVGDPQGEAQAVSRLAELAWRLRYLADAYALFVEARGLSPPQQKTTKVRPMSCCVWASWPVSNSRKRKRATLSPVTKSL